MKEIVDYVKGSTSLVNRVDRARHGMLHIQPCALQERDASIQRTLTADITQAVHAQVIKLAEPRR